MNELNRRRFVQGAALLGLAGAVPGPIARALGAQTDGNPYAYDVSKYAKTDPKLVKYEETGRFACGDLKPRRIAVGPDHRVYIAGEQGITIFDSAGSRVDLVQTTGPARCLALDEDGGILAGIQGAVELYDARNRRKASWTAPGKEAWVTAIAVSGAEVFLADSRNRAILRCDRAGKLLGRIGEKNKERNVPGIILPSPYLDVEVGKDGLLRVNNTGRHQVELYTREGDLEVSWGKSSAGIEGFCGCCNPVGLALLPDGRCVTAEKGLPRVKVYSAVGKFECVVAGPESFPENARGGPGRDPFDCTLGGLDAAVDGNDRTYVLDMVKNEVISFRTKA